MLRENTSQNRCFNEWQLKADSRHSSLSFFIMKYIFSLITGFLLLFLGLTSCDDKEEICRIGVSQCNNDKWRQQMNYEMMREAAFYEKRVLFDFCSANDNSETQIRQIDSLVNKGIDVLVVSPDNAAKLTPIIEKVWDLGIPVVVVHQKILSEKYTAYIGADNEELGRDAARFLGDALSGKGTVVELMGQYGYSNVLERHKGFMDNIGGYPQIKVAASVHCSLNQADVDHVMDSLYDAGIRPDAIFAHFNRSGIAAYEAAARHNSEVKIVGIDGSMGRTGGLRNVENGKFLASLVYPSGGAEVIHTIAHIMEDEPYDWQMTLNTAMITNENKQTFRIQSDQLKEREEKLDFLDVKFDNLLSRSSMQHMLLISCGVIILLIGLALVTGLRSYYLIIRHNEKLNAQKLKLEEQRDQLVYLSRALKESTGSKLSFYTRVSHEFRTPLTLILAPTEELEQSKNLSPEDRNLLNIIHSNADILLRLVNQSLDFRKMETGKLKLNLKYIDICESTKNWCEQFRALAQKNMIRYSYECEPIEHPNKLVNGWFDAEKLESIYYNLIANALKYTPEGGKVSVRTKQKIDDKGNRSLHLTVEDSGKGIPEDKQAHIFDLFYQTEISEGSSGIGLTTTKSYVELHGGTIKVESKVGQGSRFIAEIPYESDANAKLDWDSSKEGTTANEDNELDDEFEKILSWPSKDKVKDTPPVPYIMGKQQNEEEDEEIPVVDMEHPIQYQEASQVISDLTLVIANKPEISPSEPGTTLPIPLTEKAETDSADGKVEAEAETQEDNTPKEKYKVLVIDDNKDMRAYIRIVLKDSFIVEEAENGKEGLTKALQIIPDVIVCDLLMPEMDGWECCKRLKTEWQTSHIPVMILTACTLEEQRIKSFECGADSYVNKPFNRDVFLIRLHNLIANKKRMKEFFADKTILPTENVNDLDKGFTERFREVIENKLSDPGLSVETIATEMGMGRSQLYRKVKSLTGFTPIEMIRVTRLKKASEIMKRTDMSVSEVAYEVGFSSPGYFTKCFSDYFGTSPSNYMKE